MVTCRSIVGCDISGNALIVDDVISSGSSIIESINLINEKSKCNDVLCCFDRMEIGEESRWHHWN